MWAYRDVDGRVRSALAKFGDGNLRCCASSRRESTPPAGTCSGFSAGLGAFVRSFDYDEMTAESGAALMWLIRNQLFFDLGLDRRNDVHLVSYNDFLADPAATMRPLCRFLDLPYRPELVAHVSARPPTHAQPLDIDARIRAACDELAARLEGVAAAGARPLSPPDPALR